jgi:DNA processing protein
MWCGLRMMVGLGFGTDTITMAVQTTVWRLKAPASAEQSSTAPTSPETELLHLRALLEIEGIGALTIRKWLNAAGSLAAVWNASDTQLSQWLSAAQRKKFLQRRDRGIGSEWLEAYERLGIMAISWTDPAYPALLKEIHDPPLILYVKGCLPDSSANALAVVGTRHATPYGKQVTEALIQQVSPYRPVIISGLAKGIDTVAHQSALQAGLSTLAVFGCGLDVVTPRSNQALAQHIVEQGGALISEYPLGTPPTPYTFPKRNRIVAGLSQGIVVVEGDLKSGALITARLGLEEGRSIFAVPGNIFSVGSQGPLHLIRQGAVAVGCGEDIAKELNWHLAQGGNYQTAASPNAEKKDSAAEILAMPVPTKPSLAPEILSTLSEDERTLLQCIPLDAVAIEDLQQTSGLPSAKINQCLTMLELEGLIVLLPGAKVCRKQRC